MNPAHTPPSRSRRNRVLLGLVSVATAAGLAWGAPASAAVSSTTATPAGDSFSASVVSGTGSFTVGSVTVNCNQSTTSGAIPAAPGNHNAAGPVTGPITAPTFTNNGGACPTNVALTKATITTSGSWSVALQYDAAGSTATLTIPQGGAVATISGLASCTITIAPTGPATVTGAWVAGTLPSIDFSAGPTVPIKVTGGFGCPTSATTAVFKATYQVTDTTNPSAVIAITA